MQPMAAVCQLSIQTNLLQKMGLMCVYGVLKISIRPKPMLCAAKQGVYFHQLCVW